MQDGLLVLVLYRERRNIHGIGVVNDTVNGPSSSLTQRPVSLIKGWKYDLRAASTTDNILPLWIIDGRQEQDDALCDHAGNCCGMVRFYGLAGAGVYLCGCGNAVRQFRLGFGSVCGNGDRNPREGKDQNR